MQPDERLVLLEVSDGVTPQQLMEKVVENYNISNRNTLKHERLIEWINKQLKVK